jgi:polyhydroxyalkanoate synthesis regulator phasin
MSFISDAFSGGQQSDAMQHALNAMLAVHAPTAAELKYTLQQLVRQGQLSPEQAQVFLQDPSLLQSMMLDPATRTAQMTSLGNLQEIVDEGGLSPVDRAKLSAIRSEVAQRERGDREAVLAQAQARGTGGSNLTLQSMLLGQQGAATRESQAGLDTAAQAYQNRLQAIKDVANLGGQIRGADFEQQSAVARAQDVINQFNTQQKQAVEQSNVGTRNLAQEKNLAEQQRIADTNTAIRNQKAQADALAVQQAFNNAIARAGGTSQVFMKQSDMFGQQAQQGMQMVGGMTKAGTDILSGIKSDEREKKDVQDFDSKAFLDSIVPVRFRYKHPGTPGEAPGPQVGVMAQDVERVLPQAVQEDQNGVKEIKTQELVAPILAALTDVHARLKKVEGGSDAN